MKNQRTNSEDIQDTIIEKIHHSENKDSIVDSFLIIKGNDTTHLIEIRDKKEKIIEKFIHKQDYGKNIFVILMIIFAAISVIKRRKNG